ncbi:chromosome transmission fidelity protein 1 [Nematocida sp. LUAm3]|nr:chromosome transmission fidelity protein 1 [Nematocida sp. LUAm3]KAI5174719.1 chromosome transmission fidelity protein 1 [Nematocida sp. LUAm2]KAI5177870.1 chromosome transmission fidelity protein 1 [Nematocida sp. LUAm1]
MEEPLLREEAEKFLRELKGLSLYPGQREMVTEGISLLDTKQIGVFESPTGTGKTLSSLLIGIYYLKGSISISGLSKENLQMLGEMYKIRRRKMIYACRTHEQIDQVVKEFRKLNTLLNSSYKAVALGSRRVTCINPKVNASSDVNNSCRIAVKRKECVYYNKLKNKENKEETVKVKEISIEEAVNRGKKCQECPYFYVKGKVEESDLIVLPYSLLLRKEFFKEYRISPEDTLLLVDEAHNLHDAVLSENSVDIEIDDLQVVLSKIEDYTKKRRRKRVEALELFIFIEKLLKYLVSDRDNKILKVNAFLCESELSNANPLKLSEKIDEDRLDEELFPLTPADIENRAAMSIRSLGKFCRILGECNRNTYLLLEKDRLTIRSIAPREHTEHLEEAKSIILVGGTLFPDTEISLLFQRPLLKKTYPGVCRSLEVGVCTDALFIYKRRQEEIQRLFLILPKYLEQLEKGGILIFLQSKEVLRMCKEALPECLRAFCLFEGEVSLFRYKERVEKKKTILFCVINGSFSEGVNFSDGLCRILIICGVPLPKKTEEVEMLIQQKGAEYFLDKSMCSVNQTIGRAIRHSSDYCYVLLLDRRFSAYKEKLSKWMHEYIRTTTHSACVEEGIEKLKKWQVEYSTKRYSISSYAQNTISSKNTKINK